MKVPRLTTPAYSKRIDHSIETRPKGFRQWLDYLPFATPANAAQQLTRGIATLNRQPLPPAQRLELLELLHQPFATLSDAYLQPHPESGTRPLKERNRQLGRELRQLTTEIAFGYKLIVKESTEGGFRLGRRKLLITALQRTLGYLEQILLQAFIDYAPFPANVWREVYQIYHFAEHEAMLDMAIDDPYHRDSHPSTIDRLFKQIVLLSLIDPYRLPEGQTWLVYLYLKGRSELGRIRPLGEVAENLGYFLLDLNSDCMPQPLGNEPPPTDEPRLIDIRKPVIEINSVRETLHVGSHAVTGLPKQLSVNDTLQLLGRMQRAWTSKQSRKTPRIEEHGSVGVATGLETIHQLVSGGALTLPPDEAVGDEPIEITAWLGGALEGGKGGHAALQPWQLINRSLGGLSLAVPDRVADHLATGQLLVTNSGMDSGQTWTLAIIRWLMHDDKRQESRCGIQYLSRHPLASLIRAQVGSKLEMEPQPALIFELRTKGGMQQSLICPRGLYRANRELLLLREGRFIPHTCRQLIESTQQIDWFTFTPHQPA